LILEDFESANFTTFNWPWTFEGDADWSVVTEDPYEGTYCAKSGTITHSQTSELILIADVTTTGTISFFRKVSSESSYDYLKFYIDGTMQEEWSGEVAWSEVSYAVAAGNDIEFKWQYSKDGSVDSGSDCAWVDYIVFPALGSPQPSFSFSPAALDFGIVETSTSSSKQFTISNTGGAILSGNISTPAGYTIAAADYLEFGSKHIKSDDNSDNTISYSVPGTSNQTFDLIFSPLAAATYAGNVVISSNDPDHISNDLPVTGSGGTAAVISVTPSILDFGGTTFGSNPTLQFTIENTGASDLTGSITTPTDFSVAEFSEINSRLTQIDNVINFIIAGGNSVIYDLTFSPTTLGSYSENVTISHNAAGGTTLLPVSGNCVSNIVYPYLADFENAGALPAEWTNATDDDFDWTLLSGSTGSSNTGPSVDHTTGTGYYIYTESSSPNYPDKRADLITPYFNLDDLTTPYITFWYHMYGTEMGDLHIDIYNGSTWQDNIIPAISGDQGNQWLEQLIDLSAYSGPVQFRFRGITESSFTSDMAIDDFWIGDYDPPEISVNPLTISETLNIGQSSSQMLQIMNTGSSVLDYSASIRYTNRTTDNDLIANKVSNSKIEKKKINKFESRVSTSEEFSRISKSEFNRVLDYMIVGSGSSVSTSTNDTPFGTYYEDGQNQYLFTAAELNDAGLIAGDITTIGWNITAAATQTMEGFNIEMKHTSATNLTAFETGFSNCYSGTWTANAGWNDIPFSTPFNWDGISNLLVKICFDDTSYTSNSSCFVDSYYAMNAWAYNDGSSGCTDPYEGTIDTRPQTRFTGHTLNWLTLNGVSSVTGSINSGSSNYLTIDFDTVPDGLTGGVYQADITIESNDIDEPTTIIPVTLTVLGQLNPPTNIQAQVIGINIQLSWDVVPDAALYHIYYSTEPYTGFTELTTSSTNSYEHIGGAIGSRLYYFITAE